MRAVTVTGCRRLRVAAVAALALVWVAACAAPAAAGEMIYATVTYCPTDFTNEGAIVEVDPSSGAWSVVGKFTLPSEIFGCVANYDPTVFFDSAAAVVYLQFTEDTGYTFAVSLQSVDVVKQATPTDEFFTGFVNMWKHNNTLRGFSGTVTQTGICNDGCFEYGVMDIATNAGYLGVKLVPFKALMDDVQYVDTEAGVVYVQASYDLRAEGERCAVDSSTECLLAINTTDGTLLRSTATPDWTVYKYAPVSQASRRHGGLGEDLSVLAWVDGFGDYCKDPYNEFAFATVDLSTAKAQPIACIPSNVTIHQDPWIASFSADQSLFATGSGNAESGDIQLVVLNTTSGGLVTNVDFTGLPAQLGAAEGLVWIWSVDFATLS